MKKKFEFWFGLLSPAFVFAFGCYMFNLLYHRVNIAYALIGTFLFIALQYGFHKLLNKKKPDIMMRVSSPLCIIAALAGCYMGIDLSQEEEAILGLIPAGAAAIMIILVLCQEERK